MTINKTKIAGALMLLLSGHIVASEVSLNELNLREEFYPENFREDLQTNLNFFLDGVGVNVDAKVPYDTVFVKDGVVYPEYYVNTTEIGLYLNVLVEAEKAGNEDALIRIAEVLDTVEAAPKWNGLFYWPYEIEGDKLEMNKDEIVPAVDNGNFMFSLAAVAGAYIDSTEPAKQDIVARIETIFDNTKEGWVKLYDPTRDLLRAGWKTTTNAAIPYHIDRKANESRLAPLWAALITSDMDTPVPQSAFNNMETYTAKYNYAGREFNPILTWDGSYFQAMLPAIFLDERALTPDYTMIEDMTYGHMAYAAKHNVPLVSASATVDDRYSAYGVPFLSESKVLFNNEMHGANDPVTGTPHALALSYIVDPAMAVKALSQLKETHPGIVSPYGWFDAVDTEGRISTKILSLDQGMFVGAFLATSINEDVYRYLDARGHAEMVKDMYQSFKPDNKS
ncbi:glucoamylase family protein [Vibrio methylphosphonaticus]|uniref:glucoamylase family protein n=1 Tax=Vibrio methylphosphonaticus TaxID=2946866 RepID=UPI00202A3FED|nr:glucoamylase family protein [Vibrio methylphosphonaticus]MCL9774052.1 hypothetical protein [Vibrio methylphosphonaticus]